MVLTLNQINRELIWDSSDGLLDRRCAFSKLLCMMAVGMHAAAASACPSRPFGLLLRQLAAKYFLPYPSDASRQILPCRQQLQVRVIFH